MNTAPRLPAEPASPYRWTFILPGLLAIGWGGYGLLTAERGPDLLPLAVFLALAVLAHDALLAPLAVGVGWLLTRWAPPTVRAPLQVGAIGTGVLLLAGLPMLSGRGRTADVPSALPFDYAARVGVALGVLWVLMLAWALWRGVRRRRRAAPDPEPAETRNTPD